MDKQAVLNLSKAEALENNQFKIQVGGKDYIYQVPEDKEVELVVDKINNWVNKGVDQWGGLYDYINRNFKLLTSADESEELKEGFLDNSEDEEEKITVEEHDGTITITVAGYSADFEPKANDSVDNFKIQSQEVVKDEMLPEDYAKLLAVILENLTPLDYQKFADFMTAFSGASVEEEITDDSEDTEASAETSTEDKAKDTPESTEDEVAKESEEIKEGSEDSSGNSDIVEEPIENTEVADEEHVEDENIIEPEDEEKETIDLQELIELAKELNLSVFEFKKKDVEDHQYLYLVGRVSPDNGSLEYLTFGEDDESLLSVPDNFDAISELPQLLNNEENRSKYKEYLEKVSKTIIELDNKVTLEDVNKGE